jgi:hypothetical protein
MKCECITCPECGGSGDVWRSFSGEYLGNHRCDDLDELETCELCGGEGVTYFCHYCRERMEEGEANWSPGIDS